MMRLAVLLALAFIAPASAQLIDPFVGASLDSDVFAGEHNPTGALVVTFPVQFRLEGQICTAETVFTVPLAGAILAADGVSIKNLTAQVEPPELTFTVPAGTIQLAVSDAYEAVQQATLVVERPLQNASATIQVIAGEPVGSCLTTGTVVRSGDVQTTQVTWQAVPDSDGGVERIMPFPPAFVAVALALLVKRVTYLSHGPK